jgi:hypothetical protein
VVGVAVEQADGDLVERCLGSFTFRTTRVGRDTTLARIVRLVQEAQGRWAPARFAIFTISVTSGLRPSCNQPKIFEQLETLLELSQPRPHRSNPVGIGANCGAQPGTSGETALGSRT